MTSMMKQRLQYLETIIYIKLHGIQNDKLYAQKVSRDNWGERG